MDQPESNSPAFQVRMVTFQFTKVYRSMAISKGLILVDVLIVVGAILVAVHLFKLSRGMFSPHVSEPTNHSEQVDLKPLAPDSVK
ncbi:MAG: hypothetical protein ACFHW5_04380 [Verrucomicrobiota bacterium]|jgi:hypothetical protein